MKKIYKINHIWLYILIVLFVIIIIVAGSFLIYIYRKNYINIGRMNNKAYNQNDKTIEQASPIYINNLLIGGLNKDKWVDKNSMYLKNENIKEEDLDVYAIDGKSGIYTITDINRDSKQNNVYITTDRMVSQSEYIAVPTNSKNMLIGQTVEIDPNNNDTKIVKKALGILSLLNNTVKVNEVYRVTLKNGEDGKIICATSDGKSKFGVYSIILFTNGKYIKIIKYSYVKNVKKSVEWPVYSLKFVYDINFDSVSEIVIQETKDYEIKYTLMQYQNNQFYEILSSSMSI